MLPRLSRGELLEIAAGTGATFVRVLIALVLGLAWTVPVGVWIGLSARLARVAQPIAQVAASVPATALFPIVIVGLLRLGGGGGGAPGAVMLLGTPGGNLFNV